MLRAGRTANLTTPFLTCGIARTGELSAFVAVTVALEGIGHLTTSATDLMSNLQAGTAVFRFDKDHWVTDGRVILNLSPDEAIRFYQNDLEMVGQEMADGRTGGVRCASFGLSSRTKSSTRVLL